MNHVTTALQITPTSSKKHGIKLSDKCDPSGGFGRQPARAGRAFGSRAIPQAKPRTSETLITPGEWLIDVLATPASDIRGEQVGMKKAGH